MDLDTELDTHISDGWRESSNVSIENLGKVFDLLQTISQRQVEHQNMTAEVMNYQKQEFQSTF